MNDYNIFICYRSFDNNWNKSEDKGLKSEDASKKDNFSHLDGRYVALDIYHELHLDPSLKPFYAPKKYKTGSDFLKEIPIVLLNVKLAILVLTSGFFDYCGKDDIVTEELNYIFSRDDIKIIPVSVDGFSLENEKPKIVSLFGEKSANKFITTTPLAYKDVYDFPSKSSSLRESLKSFLTAAENDYSYEEVEKEGLLTYLNEISSCSSVTYATEKIIDALINVLQLEKQPIYEIRENLISLVEKVCKKTPHFSTLENNTLPQLLDILDSCSTGDAARDELEEFKQKIHNDQKKIIRERNSIISDGDRILTFSESKHVLNVLNEVNNRKKSSCAVYICEARAKVESPFSDAVNIYDMLKDYDEKYLISDNSIYTLMSENKITKVLIGACAVSLVDNTLVSFVNTAGTEIILSFAREFNIPVYIISESNKKLNSFNNRENEISTKHLRIKGYLCDEVNYINLNRTENIVFVSENGVDLKPIVDFFFDDIWKDKRKLYCHSNCFIKHCNEEEYQIETEILKDIKENELVPTASIISSNPNDCSIQLEKINGIRLFEFFVALDKLSALNVCEAGKLKAEILEKCGKQQELLNGRIASLLEQRRDIDIYPAKKISEFIPYLYKCLSLNYYQSIKDIDFSELCKEACMLYERFVHFVKANPVPFRDSTIKNMAISCDLTNKIACDLTTEQGVEHFCNELYGLIKSDKLSDLKDASIYNFDFSSCINLTTRYDDYVGLFMHERSYSIKTEQFVLNRYNADEEFLISLLVRYLRFGGRKLLYKLINPSFHKIRFKFDNELFYFSKMVFYIDNLLPSYKEAFPTLYKFFDIISKTPIQAPSFDAFVHVKKHLDRTSWMGMCNGNVIETI